MKQMRLLLSIRLHFLLTFLLSVASLSAQTTADWSGIWEGSLEIPGTKLDMKIELTPTAEGWDGLLDIPAQRIKDMVLGDLVVLDTRITFRLPEVPGNANYEGTFTEEKIVGTFSQAGQNFPLVFEKKDEAAAAVLQDKIAQIKVLIDSFRQGAEVPGLGLGIIHKEEIILAEGFGYRNLEETIAATADTRFAIGSSSKAFTTMGLALLADQGLLKWDSPVREYLPDFQLQDKFASEEMTPIDMTCHRSGLPRHDLLWYGTDFSREELYQRLKHLPPSASFRTKWQYQNLMYMTAGILTERLSGKSWEEFVQENIFDKLGMTGANFSVAELQETDNFSYGYGKKDDETTRLPYHQLDAIGPAGSINASVTDMLKWVELHLGDGQYQGQHFVSKSNLEKMHSPQMLMERTLIANPAISNPTYGLGWFIYDYNGLTIVEHGGNIDGFSALVFLIPDEEFGLVSLTNKNGTPLNYVLAYTIADILLERDGQDWYAQVFDDEEEEEDEDEKEEEDKDKKEKLPAPHPLEDYPGIYSHPGYGDITIQQDEEQLKATYYHFSETLEHQQYDSFKGKSDDDITFDVRFETDRNGQIIALYSLLDPSIPEIRFERQAAEKLSDPAFLETLVGTYELDGGVEVKISLEGTSLKGDIVGQPTYTLEPHQGNSFKLSGLEGFTIEFILEKDKVVALVSHQPNGDFRAERKE